MTDLDKLPLFAGGPNVARLCLGTMMFGDQTDEAESAEILERYLAAGGNFIDTADTYAGGKSEQILGRLLRGRSVDCLVATKVGNPIAGIAGSGGLARAWIIRAAEMSLERLQCDAIDLYYLHLEDEHTPLEETVTVLGELLSQGKIRQWGFSNFRPWKIAELVRLADKMNIARPVAAQPYYHLLNRRIETDYLPACHYFGIGAVPYSPLARGVLTGKYRGGTPQGSRADRSDLRITETELFPETIALANLAVDYALASDRSPISLAIKWVLANAAVPSVLIGPKSIIQLDAYLAAAGTPYAGADESYLSDLCASGHTPVPGHSDPRYPYRGRMLRG